MKVIPVIDILDGKAVHAVKGKRSEYKPIQSVLVDSTEPIAVAKAFKKLGFKQLYIADLDAIIGRSSNFNFLKQIVDETRLELMVDAGITNLQRAQTLMDHGVSKIIIGTETLADKGFVAEAVEKFGGDHVIVSLDCKGEKLLVKMDFKGCENPMYMLNAFKSAGVSGVIILDLSRVGSGEGVKIDFLQKALELNGVEIYVGGGVRDISDLQALSQIGVSGVLVATALHSGKISVDALKRASLL